MPLYVFFRAATFALFSPYFLLFYRSPFVQPYPFFYFLRGKYFSSKTLDSSLLLLRFIVSRSFCFFSNHACRVYHFSDFLFDNQHWQFVNVDKFFFYILVKDIDVINAISIFNSSSHSHIRDKNNLMRNIRNFSNYYLFHVLFLLLLVSFFRS